jgi:hypothetical protein
MCRVLVIMTGRFNIVKVKISSQFIYESKANTKKLSGYIFCHKLIRWSKKIIQYSKEQRAVKNLMKTKIKFGGFTYSDFKA